jgi:hypothetical protein
MEVATLPYLAWLGPHLPTTTNVMMVNQATRHPNNFSGVSAWHTCCVAGSYGTCTAGACRRGNNAAEAQPASNQPKKQHYSDNDEHSMTAAVYAAVYAV